MFARRHRYSFKSSIPSKVFQTPYFVIRFDNNSEQLNCAVVVGKKVDKRAVIRNKIKRLIVSDIIDLISLESKTRLLLYAKKNIKDLEKDVLKEELLKSLKTIKII